jgi:hypothetical protein
MVTSANPPEEILEEMMHPGQVARQVLMTLQDKMGKTEQLTVVAVVVAVVDYVAAMAD